MLERWFRLAAHGTSVRTELIAGATTFLTMAYIAFVQPAALSGQLFGTPTGLDLGAAATATCLSAGFASTLMGLWARLPIAQAPGMGENFFFVLTAIPSAAAAGFATPCRVALGAVFLSGVAFLLLTAVGVRRLVADAISPSLRGAIAGGIGLFIAFIGLRNAGIVEASSATAVALTHRILAPDALIFASGLLVAGALHARRVPGSILVAGAATPAMAPLVLVFFLMVVLDATGTLVAVGALLGTSTVTSYIESAAGVEQGGRTGLTSLVADIDARDVTESLPAFLILILIGIPLSYSISDGLALGFVAQPILKLLAGRAREVKPVAALLALALALWLAFLR